MMQLEVMVEFPVSASGPGLKDLLCKGLKKI